MNHLRSSDEEYHKGQWYSIGTKHRPTLRGIIHQFAFFFSPYLAYHILNACQSVRSFISTFIFMSAFSIHYGISYIFHQWNWSLRNEIFISKLDHCGIFFMIAGSYTPIGIILLSNSIFFLFSIWMFAIIGMISTIYPKTNRFINVFVYLIFGLLIVPQLPEVFSIYTTFEKIIQIVGIISYISGALVYVLKRPDPYPLDYGYHEVFHTLTVIGSLCVYINTFSIILRYK
jgi:hemolysin III